VENTVLAFGTTNFETITFQDTNYNGGFYALQATQAEDTQITFVSAADVAHFAVGDYVAIYAYTDDIPNDLLPTETSQITSVNPLTGVLGLAWPLARGFSTPSIANVTPLATTNVGITNLTIQGTEPLTATEVFGLVVQNSTIIFDTTPGPLDPAALELNTIRNFQFIGNTITAINPGQVILELPQRNSENGLIQNNTISAKSVVFWEYAARWNFNGNHFWLFPDSTTTVGYGQDVGIAISGLDITFDGNDVHGGNAHGGYALLQDLYAVGNYADYVGNITITNNTLYCQESNSWCVQLETANPVFVNNRVYATGPAAGIYITSPLTETARIQGNYFSLGTGIGIALGSETTRQSVVSGNTILSSGPTLAVLH